MKLNKPTQDAIKRALPLFMQLGGYREVEIKATTVINENGTTRERLLYHGPLPKMMTICREIFAQGGAINIRDLPWLDMNIWNYGWTPELATLRDELEKLWSNRSVRQTSW